MGCSYDPVPYTWWPSPQEVWMIDNKFSTSKTGGFVDTQHVGVYCQACGQVLAGSKHSRNYMMLHLSRCLVSPREEVPEKTEAECKTDKYKRVDYH